ncbi:MAG: NnrS family protein [Bdellovibrionales bacterium]|nr:NnrS family protein [Bdellovibrionales bacterium]
MKGALWGLAFRPFFLGASVFAVLAIGLWLGVLFGAFPPVGYLAPAVWHAHEMVYGFAVAVVAGFVLTAARNWTGKPGLAGPKLGLVFGVWLAARVAATVAPRPSIGLAFLDLSIFPLLSFALYPHLRSREMRTERVFFLYFLIFFLGDLFIHLDALGIAPGTASRGIVLGVHAVVLVIVFMGGRVIPFFTESSIARRQPKISSVVETGSHLSAWAFLFAWQIAPASRFTATVAFASAGFQLLRLKGWYVPRIRRAPLVWVLHLGYCWIAIGFLLSGLASIGRFPPTAALHAFTVGGIGVMIHGMMTRVSLGHTGRRLVPSRWAVFGYVSIGAAALVRVFGPVLLPASSRVVFLFSGSCWMAAFAVFVLEYAPMLVRARVDGRPG